MGNIIDYPLIWRNVHLFFFFKSRDYSSRSFAWTLLLLFIFLFFRKEFQSVFHQSREADSFRRTNRLWTSSFRITFSACAEQTEAFPILP